MAPSISHLVGAAPLAPSVVGQMQTQKAAAAAVAALQQQQQQHMPIGTATRAQGVELPTGSWGEQVAASTSRSSGSMAGITTSAAATAAALTALTATARLSGRSRRKDKTRKAPRVRLAANTGVTNGASKNDGGSGEPLDFGLSSQLVVGPPMGDKTEFGRTGVLLLNIGTPASTSVEDVRDYLQEFLSDDRVIDIEPAPLKWLVLQILLAVRPASSAENYRKIWDTERGSPLLYHSEDLAEGLQRELGDEFKVRIGMQYSEPTVSQALKELAASGVDNVVLVPMFPHYASGTTGSCLANAYRTAAELYCTPFLSVLPPFYNHPAYLSAMAQSIEGAVGQRAEQVDHLLFSFHGLPEEQCSRTDETGTTCLKGPNCCGKLTRANRNCYRAQCFETARRLASELCLEDGKWSVGFQSRLTLRGRIQWIRPYTDEAFEKLGQKGVKRLGVVAPSFTADCVETLEELGITGREEFAEAGGEELVVIPCLNSSNAWVKKLGIILREHMSMQAKGLRQPPTTSTPALPTVPQMNGVPSKVVAASPP